MAESKKDKKTKPADADKDNSLELEEQTARFLAAGGKIQQIPSGVSGQVQTSGPRHITLGKRNQTS